MLVLSRKRGEAITIGGGVTITVLAVQGERVKLGIVAPAEVPVHRQDRDSSPNLLPHKAFQLADSLRCNPGATLRQKKG
jgi:carbon storage regulator